MSKIPVYFMPGLAASSAIFERIDLPKEQFEVILLVVRHVPRAPLPFNHCSPPIPPPRG